MDLSCDNTNLNNEKYKVALKIINKILANLGKDEIDDLKKFIDIDRDLIIKDINTKSFWNMEDEIFEQFDKAKCGWYRRKITRNYILTFLRYMCSDLSLKFTYEQVEKTTTINGTNYRKSYMMYSIK